MQIAGRTDGKILTTVSKTNILDCHGDRIFITGAPFLVQSVYNRTRVCACRDAFFLNLSETGSPWSTFINNVLMKVAYVVYASNGTQLAYVDGTTFISDTIVVKDPVTKNAVATLYRDKVTLSSWVWQITVAQLDHPAGMWLPLRE